MPIKGLTDGAASFPQVGTLRKGAERGDRGPGRDLEYFRFDTDDAEAEKAFTAAYGPEPRAINVYLPHPTTDENLSAWQEHWIAGGLMRRCDGETCVRQRKRDGSYSNDPTACACAGLPADSRDRCKPVGRLQVIIPELKRLAYVLALTGSQHDIRNLHSQLLALEMSAGSLRGVPLVLRRRPVEISMPDNKGGRVRREKWLLSIEAAPRWVGLQLGAQERHAIAAAGSGTLALPAPAIREVEPGRFVDTTSGELLEDQTEAAYIEHIEHATSAEPMPVEEGAAVIERDTGHYVALGKKLKSYGYTTEDLKQARVAHTARAIATMGGEAYDATIAAMEKMERDALMGKGPEHVQAEMLKRAA